MYSLTWLPFPSLSVHPSPPFESLLRSTGTKGAGHRHSLSLSLSLAPPSVGRGCIVTSPPLCTHRPSTHINHKPPSLHAQALCPHSHTRIPALSRATAHTPSPLLTQPHTRHNQSQMHMCARAHTHKHAYTHTHTHANTRAPLGIWPRGQYFDREVDAHAAPHFFDQLANESIDAQV